VTGLEEERLKTAKMLGAAAVFHPALAGEAVGAITDGRGVDYVVECTGQPQVWENAVDYVRRGGTVVLFGGCRKGATVTYDAARLHYDEITLKGTFHFTPQDVRKAYVLLKKGTIVVKRLISGSCGLNGIQDVFARLSKGEGLKYAVRP
jgi:L-iditol 2-dehydrogenase